MIPRKLALRNFMCYREDVPPLEFAGLGVACLSGENGAGKSALLDALTWALWGEARLKSDDDLIALGATEMEVDLTFALDGQDYRVIRKRSKGKRVGQSWLDFQVRNNGTWKALTGGTLSETQQAITGTLHMGYETFANSAFLRQGRADEFTRKKPSERKQVLAEILGLAVYERLEGGAKERAKTFDGQIKVLEGQIAELERQAAQQQYHAAEVARAESRAAEVTAQLHAAEKAYDAANHQAHLLEQMRPQRDEFQKRLDQLSQDRDTLVIELDKLNRAINAGNEIIARRAAIEAGVAELNAARAEIQRLEGLRARFDALEKQRNQHENAILDAERQLRADLQIAENMLRALHERAAQRPKIEAEIANLRQQSNSYTTLQEELGKQRTRRAELLAQIEEANRLQLHCKELENKINLRKDSLVASREEKKRQINDYTERLKPAERWQSELGRARERHATFTTQVAELETLRGSERATAERVGQLRAECENIRIKGDDIKRKLALIGHEGHACPLCGSELGHTGVAHIEAAYERDLADLRSEFSTKNSEAKHAEAQLSGLRDDIKAHEDTAQQITRLAEQMTRLESDLLAADDLRRRQADEQRTLDDLIMQLVKGDYERGIRAELARAEAALKALGEPAALSRQMNVLEDQIGRIERHLEEQRGVRAKIDALSHDLQKIEVEMPALHEQEAQVRDLQTTQAMGDFARTPRAALVRTERDIATLGYSAEAQQTAVEQARALGGWDEEQRRLQRAEEWLADNAPRLEREQQALKRCQDDHETTVVQLDKLREQLQALGPALRARDDAQVLVQNHRGALAAAQKDLGEKQGHLQRAENAAAELFSHQQQRKETGHRKAIFDELGVAFGKKGVQALLIETAVPEIQEEANRLLGRMTDNQMHLTFETQGSTKKGDVTETLDIKIADGLGTRDYDAYSGGESFRVDFAIRIALAKLLARRAGARLETLAIDEGFGSQDAKGRERLVEAITSVQQDFKQILVVTHIQELKDMFPVQIEITKKAEGSVWTIT